MTNITIENETPILILTGSEDIELYNAAAKMRGVLFDLSNCFRQHRKYNTEGLESSDIDAICKLEEQFHAICSDNKIDAWEF